MKKLLIIALCFTLTVQLSAQTRSDGRESVGMQNGSKHFDVAAHLRQLKINEMNSQARMKRVQSKPAALRTTAPVRRSPDSMQPKAPASMKSKAPVSMQPKAPARKASPVASAKPRSTANNGGFWKYKEKLDYILEENGQIKRTFEYDYDGNATKEFSYRLQSDKTWSLEGTYEYEYEDNVIKSKIHYYDYWDGLIPNSRTKTTYVRMPSGDSWEFNRYQWNGDDWVVETPETTVEYDGEGRLTYYESPRTDYKIEYYYDENGDYHDKARYAYIYNIEQFICFYLVTLDENNRVISKEEYNITDWETGERQGNYKYEYAYDENGNQVQEITYSWDSEKEEWVASGKHEWYFILNESGEYESRYKARYEVVNGEFICTYLVTLDENNRVISEEEYNITNRETGERQGIFKHEYAYDENGNQVQEITYSWDSEKGDWAASRKYEWYFILNESGEYESRDKARYEVVNGEFICTYLVTLDENNRVISQEEYNITNWETGERQGIFKHEYAYGEDGSQTKTFYYWDDENGKWYDNPQEMTKYNKDGNVTLYENYTPNESYKNEYVYDEYSNCTKFFYWWDGENGQWHEHPKSITAYDKNGKQTLYEEYTLEDGVWYGYNKNEYAYDENGYQIMQAHYWWDRENEKWYGVYTKEEQAYDENGNQIMSAYYTWDNENDKWKGEGKEEIVYDDKGYRHITDQYSNWDSEYDCFKNWEHHYYNPRFQLVGYTYYEYDGNEYVAKSGIKIETDEHGEIVKSTNVENPETGNIYENTYNDKNLLTRQICISFNGETKENYTSTEFSYDENGRISLEAVSTWNGTEWVLSSKTEYNYEAYDTYNANIYQETTRLIAGEWRVTNKQGALKLDEGYKNWNSVNYSYDDNTGVLTDCNGSDNTYDAKSNQMSYVEFSGVTDDGEPKVTQEKEYVNIFSEWYGTNQITSAQSEWDDTQNKLVEKRKSTTEKTEEGVTILTIQTSYDGTEWTTESCYELEYDEDGVLISSAQLVNNEGTFTRNGATKYAKKYDSNGYTLLDAKYNGDENGDWICMYKGEYEYDEFGNQTLNKYECIEGWYGKYEYRWVFFYNAETGRYDSRMTAEYNYSWSDDAWVGNGNAYTREYDANGKMTQEITFTWDSEKGDWKYNTKGLYAYDENGNRTLEEQYTWDSSKGENGDWTTSSKSEWYWTNENGWNRQRDKARYQVVNGEFVCTFLVTLDENNRVISQEEFNIDWDTSEQVPTNKYIYAYDENGNRTLEEQYTWDSSKGDNGDWAASWKYECYWTLSPDGDWYRYDKARYTVVNGEFVCTYIVEVEHGLEISKKEYQIIDEENGTTVCTCDEEYRLFYNAETESYERMETKYYHWYWNGEKLVGNGEASEKEYDDFGNITKETTFRWDSEKDEWYIQNQSSYTFDTNVLTADIAMKEGQYYWKYKLLSLESSEYHEWESSYYDNKKEYFYSVFGYYYYVDGESHEIIPDGDEFVGEDLTLIDKQTYSANTDFTAHNLTYKRTFVDSEWNALYVPFNIPVETLDEEGLQAAEILTTHIYDDDQDGTVDRTTIEVVPVISGELEANVPYVIRAKELEGEKEVEINLSNILVHESENNSVDCSSTKQLFTFTGTYEPVTGETLFTDGLYYIGINAETQNVAIVQAGSAETPSLPAQRWTLAVTDRFGNKVVSNVRAIDIIMDEDATGIEAIGAGAESATDVYNVAGVKVATMTAGQSIKNLALPAGVYVNNGHKFIIK